MEHCSLGDNGKEEETSTDGGATNCVEFESIEPPRITVTKGEAGPQGRLE